MRKLFIAFYLFVFSLGALATVFIPLSIKKQIKQSDAIVRGEVSEINFEEVGDQVTTRVTIYVDRWIGVDPNDHLVDVYLPGGKGTRHSQKVFGAPEFEVGEKIIVFIKKQDNKSWINNLGLGKFTVRKIEGRELMINQIFPNHPQVGQMKLKKFYDLAEWVKKRKFEERYKDKYELAFDREVVGSKQRERRSLASVTVEESSNNDLPAYWLVILLGSLGLVAGLVRKKTS